MRRRTLAAGAAAAALAALPSAGGAETGRVVLRLKDSLIEVAGRLKSYDGTTYVVEAGAFGILSLPAGRYECEGKSCAVAAASEAPAQAAFDFGTQDVGTARSDRFSIQGSDTVGRELMPALIRAYAQSIGGSTRQLVGANPDTAQFKLLDGRGALISVIDVERASPASAFGSIRRGSAAIAMSTRPMLPGEVADLAKAVPQAATSDLEHVLALDGLAVVVAPGSPATSLPIDKLAGLFAGRIKDWSEVGLAPGPVNLYLGPESAGSTDAFNDLVLSPRSLSPASTATRLATETEVSDAVARDPNGIGITSFGLSHNARPLDVSTSCGLTWSASEFAIKAEEYPLGRRLYLYTAGAPGAAGAKRLLAFANSNAAQGTIATSPFLDQSVVSASFAEQSSRIEAWLRRAEAGAFEKRLAKSLLEEIRDGQRLSLTFRFSLGSSQLDAKARQDLNRLVELLQGPALKGKTVLLLGFTDWVGSPEANADLARRRAEEVRSAVLAAAPAGAVDTRRLVTAGYGAVTPVACNDGPEGMNRNRRVEVWVRDRAPALASISAAPTSPPAAKRKRRL